MGKGVAIPLPYRCRNRVDSLYLPACGFPAPGDSEKLALETGNTIIPAKFIVKRIVRRKYAVEYNDAEIEESEIKTATLPPQIIPQGIATPGLLTYIAVSKFCDALLLYRLEKIFKRTGIEMARSTMCTWFIDIYKRYCLSKLFKK